jgi:hypothetical protein
MIRNWQPDVERTRSGFLKNISVAPRSDAFTGQVTGQQLKTGPAPVAASVAPVAASQ